MTRTSKRLSLLRRLELSRRRRRVWGSLNRWSLPGSRLILSILTKNTQNSSQWCLKRPLKCPKSTPNSPSNKSKWSPNDSQSLHSKKTSPLPISTNLTLPGTTLNLTRTQSRIILFLQPLKNHLETSRLKRRRKRKKR